jgi:two-component system cell cycle response regulator
VLRANIRAFDSLARYGGEEFVVVMPGSSPDDAITAAERLRLAVESVDFWPKPGVRHSLSVSVGVSCTGDELNTPEALLHTADLALYEAKRQGRNRVELTPLASVS